MSRSRFDRCSHNAPSLEDPAEILERMRNVLIFDRTISRITRQSLKNQLLLLKDPIDNQSVSQTTDFGESIKPIRIISFQSLAFYTQKRLRPLDTQKD